MAKNGMQLTQNKPSYPNSLVSQDLAKSIKGKKLCFSFQYFKQIAYFEVGSCGTEWFISVVERIKDLSEKEISFFIEGNRGGKTLRVHPINWSSRNIPISKSDCNWIPSSYLDNDDDFPFYQFAVSKGKGRIVGFFNEDNTVFNIVLFDPKHNLQPSKDFNYKVDTTSFGYSEYDKLLSNYKQIENIIEKCPHKKDKCDIQTKITEADSIHNVVYVTLDDDFYDTYKSIENNKSLKELIEEALLAYI